MTIAGPIFGFWYAFGIGANDCANSFATSVAAKSVTLKMAVMIASVCEFLGAMLLGASVTSTIRNKVVDVTLYQDEPEVLMFGMLCSLVTAAAILHISNYMYAPVSTTHTIVGAIVGFSLAAKGFSSVNWSTTGQIFISWVASPLITGVATFILFWTVRKFVLQSAEPYRRAVLTYPLVIFIAVTVDIFFILYKSGTNNKNLLTKYGVKLSLPVSIGVGLICALVFQFCISPIIQKRIDQEDIEAPAPSDSVPEEQAPKAKKENLIESTMVDVDTDSSPAAPSDKNDNAQEGALSERGEVPEVSDRSMARKATDAATVGFKAFRAYTYGRDVHAEAMQKSERAVEIWARSPDYDPNAENMFSYLQVFTACLLSFGHGANDVANAIAPLSAIFLIYQTGEVESKSPVQRWALALGGAGIVVGLALYGYKLMVALGFHLTKLSPSRGFCIELCTSFVVVIASFLGIPISTTQCQVGGTVGAGFVSGGQHVDLWFFLRCAFGWVLTFVAVCLLTAGIFSFSYYAPSAPGFAGYQG